LQSSSYTLITKRSDPIGVAIAFNDSVLTHGVKSSLLIDAYKSGVISLGQLSKSLDLPHAKVMKMLSFMGINVIEYDFEQDLKTLERFQ